MENRRRKHDDHHDRRLDIDSETVLYQAEANCYYIAHYLLMVMHVHQTRCFVDHLIWG